VLYIGTTLTFFNLHLVHEYYPYSTAILLVVATGALIASVLEIRGPRAWIGVALLVLVMAACAFRYSTHYYPIQHKNAPGRPEAAALVDNTTGPESVILILGLDWSSEFPYQSHRRAIMDTPWGWHRYGSGQTLGLEPIEHAIFNEGPGNVAALVACDEGRHEDRLPALLQDVGMPLATNLRADDCDIYERVASSSVSHKP
jgi:hypothetical protein